MTTSPHSFHIPVMGTGFTIDSPVRVARYGITSVIQSDDYLMEQMRAVLCEEFGEPYAPIPGLDAERRPDRVREYLNLLDRIVQRQVAAVRTAPFAPGSEITRYFDLLPPGPVRTAYLEMLATTDPAQRAQREDALRAQVVPGGIEMNQMTKLDRDRYRRGEKLDAIWTDASTGLRGFVESTVDGAVVWSAGLNPRLYSYAGTFDAFRPGPAGPPAKRIVLKVSDHRSAVIQGKFLAKRGLWVSEYRIESGLNCGGHAFGGEGTLLGPVLEQFLQERDGLVEQLHAVYDRAAVRLGAAPRTEPRPVRFTVQGGIGTAGEDAFLRTRYRMDGTGWGTPFLLVPEVTCMDTVNRTRLAEATNGDVFLSDSSPLGIPFWNLRTSASEAERQRRIDAGEPGSPCRRRYLQLFNTEFTDRPVCLASRAYIERKLAAIDAEPLPDDARAHRRDRVLRKSCLCHDLAGGALQATGVDPDATPAVCPGPNIVNFDRRMTLDEMVDHIYGRRSMLANPDRPHMLIRELELNAAFLAERLEAQARGEFDPPAGFAETFVANLHRGITYYRELAGELPPETAPAFTAALDRIAASLPVAAGETRSGA